MADFETSASYLAALGKALKTLGVFDAVMKRVSPASAEMLRSPHTQRWWPSGPVLSMTDAIMAEGGATLIHQIGRQAVFESMSFIIRPLVTAAITFSGPSPHTLFGSLPKLLQTAVRNVQVTYARASERSGVVTITYPLEVPPGYAAYWQGALDYVFEVTRTRAEETRAEHLGSELRFTVSWH